MKKVFVSGATGFIGSYLTELLVVKGYDVIAFDRYNPNNHWGWLENSKYKNDFEVILGDIRDFDSVFNSLNGCTHVFHLAALGGIPYSYISPLAYIRTNIEGTYNILESSRKLEIEQILITSTSEVYGSAQYTPIDESHPLNGQSPYSASKIGADQLALSYYQSFNSPVKVVRPFNTYGPRQSSRAIIPSIITQILSGKEELTLGNLDPTRDLTFVKDTCDGFLELLDNDEMIGEVINIGMKSEISMRDLVDKIISIIGVSINVKTDYDRFRPKSSEVIQLMCDNSKIINNTNWRPKYNLETGLKETIDWMKENLSNFKVDIYNV